MKINTSLYIAPYLSKLFKKKIWLKLEYENITGSHKDRESFSMIREALSLKYKSVGCASTGNLAISLSFFSKIFRLKCHVWIRRGKINKITFSLLKLLGAKVYLVQKELNSLYDYSNKKMLQNNIYNCNPRNSDAKIKANEDIIKEVYKKNKKIDNFLACINNGSHILGIKKGLKKNHKLYGVYSYSKLATSINSFARYELQKLQNNFHMKNDFIEAKRKDIIKGMFFLKKEGIYAEPSSAAIVGSLNNNKLKKMKNICCIISGAGIKDLKTLQSITKFR